MQIKSKRILKELHDKDLDTSAFHHHNLSPEQLAGNIEYFIGTAQIPLGIVGPININGDYAQGSYYAPLATTEGSLVSSYRRGVQALNRAGGVTAKLIHDGMKVTPVYYTTNLVESCELAQWLQQALPALQDIAQHVSTHCHLTKLHPKVFGNRVFVTYEFTTGDAMGLNITNMACDLISQYIEKHFGCHYMLRSNLSSDKKASSHGFQTQYGKSVQVEATLPKNVLRRFFRTDAHSIATRYKTSELAAIQSGMIGSNLQLANGLAAIFIATGQDVAQIVNASLGHLSIEEAPDNALYLNLSLPCLPIATVGGGTGLPTQRACLELMDCAGSGKVNRLAEIITATLLGGELSLAAAMVAGDFITAHTASNHAIRHKQKSDN